MRRRLALLAGAVLLVGAAAARASADAGAELRRGKEAFESKCRFCHSLQTPLAAVKSRADWSETVRKMVLYGAPVNAQDREAIVRYLAARSGFARRCSGCHDATRVVDAAQRVKDWKALVGRMSDHVKELERKGQSGEAFSTAETEEIAAFLTLVLPK